VIGLILDNIVVFLYRVIVRAADQYRSRNWATTVGVVENAYSEGGSYPFAEVVYTYSVNNQNYSGRYTKGYWLEASARQYINHFPEAGKLVIRYQTEKPGTSSVRETEQLGKPA
jgi:hypothetical protein